MKPARPLAVKAVLRSAARWAGMPKSSQEEVISFFRCEAGSSDDMAKHPASWSHRTAAEHRSDARSFRAAVRLLTVAMREPKSTKRQSPKKKRTRR